MDEAQISVTRVKRRGLGAAELKSAEERVCKVQVELKRARRGQRQVAGRVLSLSGSLFPELSVELPEAEGLAEARVYGIVKRKFDEYEQVRPLFSEEDMSAQNKNPSQHISSAHGAVVIANERPQRCRLAVYDGQTVVLKVVEGRNVIFETRCCL